MAAGFFKTLTNNLTDIVKSAIGGGNPYEVQEINPRDLTKFSVACKDDCLTLYKASNAFLAVLHCPDKNSKAFSLFRLSTDVEAMTRFSCYSSKLLPLYQSSSRLLAIPVLQQICDAIREYPTWTSAHLAAHASLQECFKHHVIAQQLCSVCETTQMSPIHVAVQSGNLDCIQELLICGAKVDLADSNGDNVFHFAAKTPNPKIIQMLASRDKSALNQLNLVGESPLHTACISGHAENVEQLLRWGSDPTLTMSIRYPIHCAMKMGSSSCIETLCKWNRAQIHLQDTKYGGTPLHWAKNKECILVLADLGCNLEIPNKNNETALHIMIKRDRVDCVMALLSRGANAATTAASGNNALHLSILNGDLDLVQTLIVFGAEVNGHNMHGQSPRHLAAISSSKDKDLILHMLHRVGARRCHEGMMCCTSGCSASGRFDGTPPGKVVNTPETPTKKLYDTIASDLAIHAALTRSASASGSAILGGDSMDQTPSGTPAGDRPAGMAVFLDICIKGKVLCLDGGGIRGLVLIQILLAIEKAVGRPIRNCFDWVAGTSTGGILALAIVQGKPIRYCQGLYFRLKDEVFTGKRPYSSEPLELFMKREFGEHTRMSEVEYPKVVVTAVLGDRHPADLHMFRNYDPPGYDYSEVKANSLFETPPRPNEQHVWIAARASGAAPTYFRSMGRFLDGGLIANNPTLDTLTEIHEYNMGLRAVGQGDRVRPIHLVVSLGTGKIPITPVKACDVFRPEGLFDMAKVYVGAQALTTLMVDQATQSEGRPVERARAWCSMVDVPFFRFSPQLSEEVPLDATDNKTLINMLWETQCYLYENRTKLDQLATVLCT